MESAHTHHPQSAPIMPCSPYSPWLWLRHAIMAPLPYLTHSYVNTRFHRNIWWQEFLSLPPPPSPDYVAIGSLGPGIDDSRLIVISHIWCSPRCGTCRRRVLHCRRACFCLHARHADGQTEKIHFHAAASDVAYNAPRTMFADHRSLMLFSRQTDTVTCVRVKACFFARLPRAER